MTDKIKAPLKYLQYKYGKSRGTEIYNFGNGIIKLDDLRFKFGKSFGTEIFKDIKKDMIKMKKEKMPRGYEYYVWIRKK